MKNTKTGNLLIIIGTILLLCLVSGFAYADQDFIVSGKNYTFPDDSNYDYTTGIPSESFFYGANSLGTLRLSGEISKMTSLNDYISYGATGSVSVRYIYDGAFQRSDVSKWYVDSDGTRWIRSYDMGFLANIGHGCIMIEKSVDGLQWEKAAEPKKDYFTKAKSEEESLIYTIQEAEFKNGMYYRIVVAYRMARQKHDGFLFLDDYDLIKCVEAYEFYVSSENNHVVIRDLGNGSILQDHDTTETGFQVYKQGSEATVAVLGYTDNCRNFEYFSDPGEYIIKITTKLGTQYSYHITVVNGIEFLPMEPKLHSTGDKDKGFPVGGSIIKPWFGNGTSLTTLSIAVPKGNDIKQVDSKYGIKGKSVSLYLKLNQNTENLGEGWKVVYDQWGKNSKELVNGISTGEIGKGALIIQTSADGKNWNNEDKGRYAKGLYTTDYATHYYEEENVLIYTPSGQDVINGVYIRVMFAYQIYHEADKKYRDYIEVYQFYLCSNELDAVTFHNLSLSGKLADQFTDVDENTLAVYQGAETLADNSYTTTGFQIDKQWNPTVQINGLCNGLDIGELPEKITNPGRYDLTLTSAVGDTKEITLFVDTSTPEKAFQNYFQEGFILDKRIFSENEYPVFECGETAYHIAGLNPYLHPITGQIMNMTTGSITPLQQTQEEITGIITEPGEYQAVFATNEDYFTGNFIGDARVFTFHFLAIPQGTAPGPVINQKMLKEYTSSTVSDANPIYYGLTYSSAGKGNITLAFANKEAAVEYAYNYEKGTVEKQENGGYRYTGSFHVTQKTKYDSAWDLTDAFNYFAEAAVQKQYFNLADEFTYLSLKPEILERTANLKKLELSQSVTIFADGQKEVITDTETLPILNDKKFAYLNPETGEVERGTYSFEFITDQFGGIDSKSVIITDINQQQHTIRYSESVGQQLLADNCPSGIVTIREETKYGDYAEYQAVYIAPEDNRTELTIKYYIDGNEKTKIIDSKNAGTTITAESFVFTSLKDELDPYALIVVKHNQDETALTAKDGIDTNWTEPGEYKISCFNRLGYGYTIQVTVKGTEVITPEEQNIAEVTSQPNAIEKSMDTNIPDAEKAATEKPDAEQTLQPDPSEQPNDAVTVDPSAEQNAEIAEKKAESNNASTVIICVIAGLVLIAAAGIIIYRKGKMYTRMTDNMKREGEDSHE